MNPAVIGAVGNVLGGLLGRKKTPTPAQSIRSHIKGVMMASKESGIHPLTILGANSAPQWGPTPGNSFGQGVANAAQLLMEDKYDQQKAESERQRLAEENAELSAQVDNLRLRPPTPGIMQTGAGFTKPYAYDDGKRTQVSVNGVTLSPDLTTTDAEVGETRYGEAAGEYLGLAALGSDFGQHARRTTDRLGFTNPKKHYGGELMEGLASFVSATPKTGLRLGRKYAQRFIDGYSVPFSGNHLTPKDWYAQQ